MDTKFWFENNVFCRSVETSFKTARTCDRRGCTELPLQFFFLLQSCFEVYAKSFPSELFLGCIPLRNRITTVSDNRLAL
jgi:hypothetical protein